MNAAPFEAFSIRTSDGREYIVPTADHAAVHPNATRVFVFFDNRGTVELAGLHVAAVLKNGQVQQ